MSGDRKSMCDECGALLRHPWTLAAHNALLDVASKLRPQGIAEVFTCTCCGTRWERFRRKAFGTSPSAVWRTL